MRDDLKKQLLLIAQNRLKANSYDFSGILKADLEDLIDKSVQRMSYSEYTSETKILEARINTLILADAMLADGRIRDLKNTLDFKSLSAARASICPLWPFC